MTVETEPSAAEGDATPAKGSKKAKAEKGAVAGKREKPEKGQKGGKDQAVRASGTEDSGKPDKGKKKS